MQFLTVGHNGTGLKFEIILGFPELNKKVRNMRREKEKMGIASGGGWLSQGHRTFVLQQGAGNADPERWRAQLLPDWVHTPGAPPTGEGEVESGGWQWPVK